MTFECGAGYRFADRSVITIIRWMCDCVEKEQKNTASSDNFGTGASHQAGFGLVDDSAFYPTWHHGDGERST